MKRQLKILEYALASLVRRKGKNLAVGLVFSLTVAALASIVLLTQSLRREAELLLGEAPDLVVQRLSAGRHDLIPLSYGETIGEIRGVGTVTPRVWGYYYDALTEANYTVLSASGLPAERALLEGRLPAEPWEAAVGRGVAGARRVAVGEDLILVNSAGIGMPFDVTGIFEVESSLLTNDLVVLTGEAVTEFFSLPPDRATDLVVTVGNSRETGTVAGKIKKALPDTRPISRSEILRTYEAVFNWRGGMMLAAFTGALMAFAVIAWDKATGISAGERREIGILKALGWDTSDVLLLKFWEGAALSVTSLLLGLILGWCNIALLGGGPLASVLKGWSVIFPEFDFVPPVAGREVLALAVATVGPYMVATIIPAWKAAVTDPESVIRS